MSGDVQLELPGVSVQRTLDVAVTEAAEIVSNAKADHDPARTFLLLSGGNDSLVLLDACAHLADEVVHINTGIGVPATSQFARRVGSSYGKPFRELHPPIPFRELCLTRWDGLPGPGAHRFTYTMLKERCVEDLLRHHRTHRGERFLLLTGARRSESKRRMGHAETVRRNGGQVWVNPLISWSAREMASYRAAHGLEQSEVAANLHMSGECLCGAMADQDAYREERAALKFFYPEVEAEIAEIEQAAKAAGCRYTEWGVKRPAPVREVEGQMAFEPLCSSCELRSGAV